MKHYLLLLMLFNGLMLEACSAFAPDVGVVTDAELAHERRTRTTILNDRTIEAVAYEDLRSDEDLSRQSHVTVSAYNGTVLLTGEVANAEVGQKIASTVQNLDNIRQIHNYLSIAPPSDANSRSEDQRLRTTVMTALQQIRSLPHFDPAMVKVVCDKGIVYLMGAVHRSEGTVVVNVTRLQPGIKQIITVFQYLD